MPGSLKFALKNASDSSDVVAYITGLAIQHGNQRCLVKADGSFYIPTNPPAIGSPLAQDCAIHLGAPGNTVNVTVPQIAGGRLWFSRGKRLTFVLNPGPALVEPSVLNPADPNADVDFGFCEFTLNDAQFYANISYVDFVPALPIGIHLTTSSGAPQNVTGMPANGINTVAAALRSQASKDGRPWDKLIVASKSSPNKTLRVLNATHAGAVGASFNGYYEPYVDQVWQKYSSNKLSINTQAAAGTVNGSVNGSSQFSLGGQSFSKPSTADIFGCDSGPFSTNPPEPTRLAIIPRLAAAFQRSTILDDATQPAPHSSSFYKRNPTNHYSRVVHEANADGKGYAFAYDDVQADGAPDQSGKVNAGDPTVFTVTVGGGAVHGAATQKNVQHPNGQQVLMSTAPPQGNEQQTLMSTAPPQENGEAHHGLKDKLNGVLHRVTK